MTFLTTSEFSKITHYSKAYITRLIRQGVIRASRMNGHGHWRIADTELSKLTEHHEAFIPCPIDYDALNRHLRNPI